MVQFGGNDIRDALTAAQVVLLTGGTPEQAQQAAGEVIALGASGYTSAAGPRLRERDRALPAGLHAAAYWGL